jgi:hypothetical protein
LAMVLSSKSSVIISNVLRQTISRIFARSRGVCLFGSRHSGAACG